MIEYRRLASNGYLALILLEFPLLRKIGAQILDAPRVFEPYRLRLLEDALLRGLKRGILRGADKFQVAVADGFSALSASAVTAEKCSPIYFKSLIPQTPQMVNKHLCLLIVVFQVFLRVSHSDMGTLHTLPRRTAKSTIQCYLHL